MYLNVNQRKRITKCEYICCCRDERKWRKWADEVLVHTLSPNVYRTLDEAYKTFNWFSEVSIYFKLMLVEVVCNLVSNLKKMNLNQFY